MSPRARLLLGAWSPPAAWAALIFVLSSLPLRTERVVDIPGADKAGHLVEYAVLGLLAARAAARTWPRRGAAALVAAAAGLSTVYGLSDEAHQCLVPERAFEWSDLAADALGALAGAAAFAAVRARALPPTSGDTAPAPGPPPGAPRRP